MGDGEFFTKVGNGHPMPGVFYEYTQDKKEGVAGIGDDGIRQDGMGTSAGADDPGDPDAGEDRPALHKVHDKAAIIGVNAATSFASTGGTNLSPGNKLSHKGTQKRFR